MKKLLTIGDSHSSTIWGESWPDFLASDINYELFRASSPGAGNAFYIEKLHEGLKEFKPDLVVIQLTEPIRVVTGYVQSEQESFNEYDSGCSFKDLACYTWNAHNNNDNLNVNIDEFWFKQVVTSKWIYYKVMQDVFTLSQLCIKFNTPVVFWSWNVPFQNLFVNSYDWLKKDLNYVEDCGESIMRKFKQPFLSPTNYHYGPSSHKLMCTKWLSSQILKKL